MRFKSLIYYPTLLFILIFNGCDNPLSVDEGQWISDIPFTYTLLGTEHTLPHDNRIYESANFLIFSDASSDEVKKKIARMAEKSLVELKLAFNISSSEELGIINRESKVIIFADRYQNYSQIYFPCGIIIFSIDSPKNAFGENYNRLVMHELMHVFQHLLGLGLDGYDYWPEVWFSEGIAEYMSGGTQGTITNMNQVNEWFADEAHINPISIHKFNDYAGPYNRRGEYYPMFELAVRYLLDERGQGKTLLDLKNLYEALKNNTPFDDAFESNMGMSITYYESHFYELISEYLQ
ncbi:MAG: hypothetical protein OEM46_03630 [Ignavibacteria bacterium]|nr:hypothetical protein [Ignavibacteria bacterium]